MGDEFDGCECIWSHELAMQRLLAFIRQNQDACTDTECVDVSGRLQSYLPTADDTSSSFTITTMLMLLAMFMYIVRPEALLGKLTGVNKRRRGNDDSAPPPPPPPAAPPAVN